MGLSDIIPGISGSTIALITGIYERFISAISNTLSACRDYVSGRPVRSFDHKFLLQVVAGIFIAIIAGSFLLSYFLKEFEVYVLAALTGLIAMAGVLLSRTSSFSYRTALGVIVGVGIGLLSPLVLTQPHPVYLFFAGMLAISAMLLPGISGSFVLLILGVYEVILQYISLFSISLVPFIAGVLVGIVTVVKGIKLLLQKYRVQTLQLLIGFVLGSLIVPLRRIVQNYAGESVIVMALLVVLSAGVVYLVQS